MMEGIMAFILYVIFTSLFGLYELGELGNLSTILFPFAAVFGIIIYHIEYYFSRKDEIEKDEKSVSISKEVIRYIPVMTLQIYVATFVVGRVPVINSIAIEDIFDLFLLFFITVILAPVYEEVIFRYLPRKLIKNNFLFIVLTSFVFALLHVLPKGTLWPFFIWNYLINSVYLGYRYSKTQDLRVTVALHRTNNLVAFILMLFPTIFITT